MSPIRIIAITLLLIAPIARADNEFLPKDYLACKDKNQSTMGMNECYEVSSKKLDIQLNANYKSLMAVTEPALQNSLKEAQRNWLKWREQDCRFQSSQIGAGGSIAGVIYADCMINITAERIAELKMIMNGEGN